MHGEFIRVWPETWSEIWEELASQETAPDDLYCELYRELADALQNKPNAQELADIIDDPVQSKEALLNTKSEDFAGERALTGFFEKTHDVLDDLVGDAFANLYFNLLTAFIEKFSLRYDLRRPCILCPTLPGVFASLVRDLRTVTGNDAHLDSLMKEFENTVRDLRTDCSAGRIKTCIQKQVNLLEAMGRQCPGVTQTTLGRICDQVGTWPHEKIKEAMKNLYGFTNDYPGIRHAGTPASAIRDIEMRDMVAMSILLAGFMPYLTDQINADLVYRGA
jgi:hypothetical protein